MHRRAVLMQPTAWDLFVELKGYVDACIDNYGDADGIPFSVMEKIQEKIKAVHVLESREGSS